MNIPDYIWKFVQEHEGGGSLHKVKHDSGGLTKWGISEANNPDVDVKNLTEHEARAIYNRRYWSRARCHLVKDYMQLLHFNASVNCGPHQAILFLQRTIKVKADGKIGPRTLAALQKYSAGPRWFAPTYAMWQLFFYLSIILRRSTQLKFARGWFRRTADAVYVTASNYGSDQNAE